MNIIVAAPYWQNVLQLFAVLIVFALILVAAYFTTRFIGKTSLAKGNTRNITVVETYKIAPNKYIQIVQIGKKYYAIGVGKDHIEYLTEIDETQIEITPQQPISTMSFREAFEKTLKNRKKNK